MTSARDKAFTTMMSLLEGVAARQRWPETFAIFAVADATTRFLRSRPILSSSLRADDMPMPLLGHRAIGCPDDATPDRCRSVDAMLVSRRLTTLAVGPAAVMPRKMKCTHDATSNFCWFWSTCFAEARFRRTSISFRRRMPPKFKN